MGIIFLFHIRSKPSRTYVQSRAHCTYIKFLYQPTVNLTGLGDNLKPRLLDELNLVSAPNKECILHPQS